MDRTETVCRRKEARYRTCNGRSLDSIAFVELEEPILGTVIDISPSGLRLLADGKITVGQPFLTELRTNRLHGVYGGVVRRVEPWVDGTTVLGCQLLDKIPVETLETLANEGVIDRRQDERLEWEQMADLSWELKQGDVPVKVVDCSPGGMKLISQVPIPDDVGLRVRIDVCGRDMDIDARYVWQEKQGEEYLCGVAFTNREVPEAIARIMKEYKSSKVVEKEKEKRRTVIRQSLLVTSLMVIFAVALLQVWN